MTFATADDSVAPAGNPAPAAPIPAPPSALLPGLARYDEACRAVAVARTVDDVREIAAHAEAVRAYARQAKNKQMELDAAEIRIRAERRLGELMAAQAGTVGLAKPPSGKGQHKADRRVLSQPDGPPTLAEAGIDKNLAHRARTLAAVPEKEFEELLDEKRHRRDRRVALDPEVQADAAAEDRGPRSPSRDIAPGDRTPEALAAENKKLSRQVAALRREIRSLEDRVKRWKARAELIAGEELADA